MATSIRSVAQLQSFTGKLGAIGIEDVEYLTHAAQVAGPELEAYLNVPLDPLIAAASANAATIPASAAKVIFGAEYPLGVALDEIALPKVAPPVSTGAVSAGGPPASVDLRSKMSTIRDQQSRGTCVAHAALSAYEGYLRGNGSPQDLSEQFLYWDCKRTDGHPNTEGTWLGVAVPLLQRDGCCPEGAWPYVGVPVPGNEGQGPPPPGAQLQALTYRVGTYTRLAPTSVTDIKNELAAGRAVAFSIPVFNSWYRNSWVAYTGDIGMPIPNEVRVGGHAMCLVGYVDQPGSPETGGGRFILRNSWGQKWGMNSQYGSGYGTIPYGYIARFCVEAYCVG